MTSFVFLVSGDYFVSKLESSVLIGYIYSSGAVKTRTYDIESLQVIAIFLDSGAQVVTMSIRHPSVGLSITKCTFFSLKSVSSLSQLNGTDRV